MKPYVRRPPSQSLIMKPPIQSTKTSRRKVFRKFFDFASLPAERTEFGVIGRSAAGVDCFRNFSCERRFSPSSVVTLAESIGLLLLFCKFNPRTYEKMVTLGLSWGAGKSGDPFSFTSDDLLMSFAVLEGEESLASRIVRLRLPSASSLHGSSDPAGV